MKLNNFFICEDWAEKSGKTVCFIQHESTKKKKPLKWNFLIPLSKQESNFRMDEVAQIVELVLMQAKLVNPSSPVNVIGIGNGATFGAYYCQKLALYFKNQNMVQNFIGKKNFVFLLLVRKDN